MHYPILLLDVFGLFPCDFVREGNKSNMLNKLPSQFDWQVRKKNTDQPISVRQFNVYLLFRSTLRPRFCQSWQHHIFTSIVDGKKAVLDTNENDLKLMDDLKFSSRFWIHRWHDEFEAPKIWAGLSIIEAPTSLSFNGKKSCQLGDGLCHRSHLLGEPKTTIDGKWRFIGIPY